MAKYVVVGTTNRSSNGTEEVKLAEDKVISKTKTAELDQDELALIRSLGVVVEKVSAKEAEEIEARGSSIVVGTDTAGSAPIFDQSSATK